MADTTQTFESSFELVRVLNPDGSVTSQDELPDLSDEKLRSMYEWMVLARHFDARCVALQRQGRMGTFPPMAGQEAAQVGSAFALEKHDWLFPSYRDHAAVAIHGMPLDRYMGYWMGREDGSAAPEGVNVFTVAIPIATQIPHAVGAAWAARLKGDPVVSLVYFGDGGTSEGDFHEGANFAGVFDAPCILFCQNNLYAISVPFSRQTRSATIAQKAVAYGFPGVRVDGNDVLAVYKVTKEAVDRARAGKGPTLIEALTYRHGPHTTVDDPTRYRPDDEVARWQDEKDPIIRFRKYLERRGLWSPEDEERLEKDAQAKVAEAVEGAEKAPDPDPASIFDYVWAEIPEHLAEQKTALLEELAEQSRRDGEGG